MRHFIIIIYDLDKGSGLHDVFRLEFLKITFLRIHRLPNSLYLLFPVFNELSEGLQTDSFHRRRPVPLRRDDAFSFSFFLNLLCLLWFRGHYTRQHPAGLDIVSESGDQRGLLLFIGLIYYTRLSWHVGTERVYQRGQ